MRFTVNNGYRHVAFCGVFTALAMIFSYIEALIPIPLGIPGAKLGFANICIIVVLYMAGARAAFFVDVLRIVLTGMLFGSMPTFLFSITGGILSVLVMIIAKKTGWLSMLGVSVLGGISHNIGQLACAVLVMEGIGIAWYLPVLLVAGVLTGIVNGVVGKIIFATLKKYSGHGIV
jgi:heptaprenyl diphosphate synthase